MCRQDQYPWSRTDKQNMFRKSTDRIAPIGLVMELDDGTIFTNLNSGNSLHRYPWLCSLRSKDPLQQYRHYGAVTLLSRPRAPLCWWGQRTAPSSVKQGAGRWTTAAVLEQPDVW